MAYGRVESTIWRDKGIRKLPEDARTLFIYLLTTPHKNRLGCYVLDPHYAAGDLQWGMERAEVAMRALEDAGRISHDPDTGVVLLYGFLKHNEFHNRHVVTAARKDLDALPDTPLLSDLLSEVRKYEYRSEAKYEELIEALESRCGDGIAYGMADGTPDPSCTVSDTVDDTSTSTSAVTSTRALTSTSALPELPVDCQEGAVENSPAAGAGVENVETEQRARPPPRKRSDYREEAEGLIASEMLMGQEVVRDGKLTLELSDQLKGWDHMVKSGTDPEALNGGIRHLRQVLEGDLREKAIGFGLLKSKPAILNQAIAQWQQSLPPPEIAKQVAEGMKRMPKT